MALLNDPTRGQVVNTPGFFQQRAAQEQSQLFSRLELEKLQKQIQQIGQPKARAPLTPSQVAQKRVNDFVSTLPPDKQLDFFRQQAFGKKTPQDAIAQLRLDATKEVLDPKTTKERRIELQNSGLLGKGQTINIGGDSTTKTTLQLRGDFAKDKRVSDLKTVETFTDNAITALKFSKTGKTKGPADIALAKAFQKLTDLGSAVREGEFATTFAGQSLINKIRGIAQRVIGGGLGFTPEDREAIVDLAIRLRDDSRKQFNQAFDEFTVVADELGLNKRVLFGGREKFSFGEPAATTEPLRAEKLIQAEEDLTKKLIRAEIDSIDKKLAELEAKKARSEK